METILSIRLAGVYPAGGADSTRPITNSITLAGYRDSGEAIRVAILP